MNQQNYRIYFFSLIGLLCTMCKVIETTNNNDNSSNLWSNDQHNHISLPPMPTLNDYYDLPKSLELIKNASDRTVRSSFFSARALDADSSQLGAESASVKLLIRSMNNFTFKLFNFLMNKYDNILISPISLYSNLIALHAASSGTTEAQLSKLLSLSGVSEKQIAIGYRSLLDLMEKNLGSQNHLKILNSMLVDKRINVSPSYQEKMKRYYNMNLQIVDFPTETEHIYQYVNNQVRFETDGNIQSIMDRRPDPLSKLLLLNAIHFQGVWAKSFNPKDTTLMLFKNIDSSMSRVKMMKMINDFKVHCDNSRSKGPIAPLCSIKIPYADEQITMQIIQSANSRISLKDALEKRLNENLLRELDAKLQTKFVELGLPSFRLEDIHELREPMDFLGSNSMFTKDKANLSKFLAHSASTNVTANESKDTNVDLFVNEFRHKASIAIDEKGTTASAATSVLIGNRSGNNKFYVDRPFILLIRDERSGAILFIGRVNGLNSEN